MDKNEEKKVEENNENLHKLKKKKSVHWDEKTLE